MSVWKRRTVLRILYERDPSIKQKRVRWEGGEHMQALTEKRLVHYEMAMRKAGDPSFQMTEDYFCLGCKCHRPEWKYRFCKHLECPYIKGQKTFREEAYRDGTE